MKFAVEAHLGLKRDVPRLVFKHPQGTYEVHLENHDVRPGIALPLLHAYVLFEAEDIDTAATLGSDYLDDFTDTLAFCSGMRFRKHHRLALFDWTPGLPEHRGRIYKSQADPNIPELILDDSFIPALESCLVSKENEPLRRALRWFSNGVSASYQDEQFQMFWFCIETVADYSSDRQKVADKCAHCHGDLYCPKCDKISMHRPYPKQKIEELFKRHVTNDADKVFLLVNDMRNAMSHGERIKAVEEKHRITLSQLVDVVGKVAWAALFRAIQQAGDPVNEGRPIRLGQPTTFLHYRIEPTAFVGFPGPKDRELAFTDIPNLEMELEVWRTEDGPPPP